jgi:hypothetical protein
MWGFFLAMIAIPRSEFTASRQDFQTSERIWRVILSWKTIFLRRFPLSGQQAFLHRALDNRPEPCLE